jgi:hypothetical protein
MANIGWTQIPIARQIKFTYTPTGDEFTALVAAPEYAGQGEAIFLAKRLDPRNPRLAQIPIEESRESPFVDRVNGFYLDNGNVGQTLSLKPEDEQRWRYSGNLVALILNPNLDDFVPVQNE